jgi:hypothetical protein
MSTGKCAEKIIKKAFRMNEIYCFDFFFFIWQTQKKAEKEQATRKTNGVVQLKRAIIAAA